MAAVQKKASIIPVSEDKCWFACCEMKRRACCQGGDTLANSSFLRLAECQQIRPLGSVIHGLQLLAPLILIPMWESVPSIYSERWQLPPTHRAPKWRTHLNTSECCYVRCCYFGPADAEGHRHLKGDKTMKRMGVKMFKFINLKEQGRDSFIMLELETSCQMLMD